MGQSREPWHVFSRPWDMDAPGTRADRYTSGGAIFSVAKTPAIAGRARTRRR